jgi:hypothetical protein
MTATASGWLEISTAGFASLNNARPPEHLVKELVQNSFDAIGSATGRVDLTYAYTGSAFTVACRDTGDGMLDLDAIRIVYLTFKKDSHLKRGRFGRGFKEVLSVAQSASVVSGLKELHFVVEEGRQVTRPIARESNMSGTLVTMQLPWGAEVVDDFDVYFSRFIVPANITFTLNGRALPHRLSKYQIEANLTTEVYHADSSSWRKPRRKSSIDLIPVKPGEEPTLYELGIPVASAEWSLPFHVNVLQRVPMNPNRDALASGYCKSVHSAALPVLIPDLSTEQTTADWVGTAAIACDAAVQREVLTKAFGDHAVRSVPKMNKRDFDDDAARTGAVVIKTSLLSGGFREMAREHLPSAKQRVDQVESKLQAEVATWAVIPEHADGERFEWITKRGGLKAVERCLEFAVWFCQRIIDYGTPPQPQVTGAVAIGRRPQLFLAEISQFMAHWSSDNKLTLALDEDCFWVAPTGAEALSVLVHEAAHARNMNHGAGFNDEVERLAGVAAAVMFEDADYIRQRWPEFVLEGPHAIRARAAAKQASSWLTGLTKA